MKIISFWFSQWHDIYTYLPMLIFLVVFILWVMFGIKMKKAMHRRKRPKNYIRIINIAFILSEMTIGTLFMDRILLPLNLDRDLVEFSILTVGLIAGFFFIIGFIRLLYLGEKAKDEFFCKISEFIKEKNGSTVKATDLNNLLFESILTYMHKNMALLTDVIKWKKNNVSRFFCVSQVRQSNLGLAGYSGIAISTFAHWMWSVNKKLPNFTIRKKKTYITDLVPNFERQNSYTNIIEEKFGGKWEIDINPKENLKILKNPNKNKKIYSKEFILTIKNLYKILHK